MENPESETSSPPEESALNRNRSFKSKQLVRSQAIRESQSPPRPASPAVDDASTDTVTATGNGSTGNGGTGNPVTDVVEVEEKRRPVEIHITGGAWESGEQKSRRRWPQQSRDLLSNGPRVACVAGCRSQCRGQRRRNPCPTKQDSGISCPDDCTDCSDFEHTGGSSNDVRKACSLDSDESYCRCPEGKIKPPKTNSLSRTDSDNKMEPTGPELVNFIRETLNKNTRDRMLLLKIEKELHALVTDTGRCNFKFPCMTSYERMLVHRVATLFQLTHHLDQNSKNSVTVSKSGTSGGRIPCTSFKQWCTVNFPPSPVRQDGVNAKSILKRDTHSPEDANAASRAVERSKSLEQREREYERVRRRIFSTDNCSQDESQWPWLQAGPVKLLTPDSGRNKLLKVQSLEGAGPPQSWRNRGPVSKSHSFGGYGGGAENAPTNQPRLLSRQGDLASSSWRLSPSSSGYKTLSLRSTDSVTPSPTGGASPEPGSESVVFAVAELACVPPGALVIHPQTGRPLTNPDGSVYHFDPQNPPVMYDTYQDQKIQNCEKRRGRLEKQHSFIDTEAECRCDDGRSKCCCECRRHDGCNQRGCDNKISVQPEQKTTPIPSSPVKNRYEQNAEQTTNQTTPPDTAANHRQPYDAAATRVAESTNQRPEIQNVQTFEPQNQVPFEPQRTEFENQRPYEPKVFENRTFEASNQRPPSFDPLANQRTASENATNQMAPVNKLTNQESVEMPQYVPQHYHKGFRNDEVTSPPQMVQNPMMADVGVYNIMAQAKVTPVPVDPNLREYSLFMAQPETVMVQNPMMADVGVYNIMAQAKVTPVPVDPNLREYSLIMVQPETVMVQNPMMADVGVYNIMAQAKVTPVPVDPNLREYSLFMAQPETVMVQNPMMADVGVYNIMAQAKVTPVPVDPNLREYSLIMVQPETVMVQNPMMADVGVYNIMAQAKVTPVPVDPNLREYSLFMAQPETVMVQNPMMADVGVYNIMAQAKVTPVPVDPNLREYSLIMVQPETVMVQNPMMADVGVYNIMAQAKVTPVPVDPNLRPVSLTNMVFPAVAPAYPYLTQMRMDQPLQPMYQPLMEEQKLTPSPHNEPFRIDPSYQYAYPCGACAGACLDPHQHQHQRPYSAGYGQLEQPMLQQPYPVGNVLLQHNVQHYPYKRCNSYSAGYGQLEQPMLQQPYPVGNVLLQHNVQHYPYKRCYSYSAGYGQLEQPMLQQPYPVGNVLLQHNVQHYPYKRCYSYSAGYGQLEQLMLQQPYPVGNVLLQHNVQHYPYPDAMQWGSPMIPGAPPKLLMHELCPVYPQYPYMYPQMLPQPYPIVQPIYPTLDKDRRPRRAHTLPTSQRTTPQPRDRDSEIALKIQQIKEQMAHLNTQDKEKSGNGLLGNAPPNYNGRLGRSVSTNDETQLSSAARAIVNSIRNMQAHAHTTQHDARRHMGEGYRERRDERDDKRRPHRQMSPGNWCRRSPGPMHPTLNHPRRPHPDTRNGRR
ncbi:uncharacterized protein LOC134676793 [Cydia fagiglandana]|uniref:uncharacterized protein LOC134676793 n=1 Tax=Cydia fagiglandana TaxID=1458189 RepID=UPI002FEDE5E4